MLLWWSYIAIRKLSVIRQYLAWQEACCHLKLTLSTL